MVTVRVERESASGARIVVRVTARDIETAARLTGGRVLFPIDPDEFWVGSGPSSFHSVDEIEAT